MTSASSSGLEDQGIGVLQKDGRPPVIEPGRHGPEALVADPVLLENRRHRLLPDASLLAEPLGKGPDPLGRLGHPQDILLDLGHRPERKGPSLVGAAESALVPGAVAGHPDQQAPGLARRPDRPLFERTAIMLLIHLRNSHGQARLSRESVSDRPFFLGAHTVADDRLRARQGGFGKEPRLRRPWPRQRSGH